ncbi:MAG: lysyl-tRNA synthetase [Candidatus Kaiserbacteria bacterium GW2011_GWB1_52_6]|uniref:Lysine--tRNA ligase n=2 Tax=Candidatus Kaiseribacteriota TaxID=1752734 RepID=A0A0G2A2Z1_9BACT|nr:MAG: lysyl-tRNA synthetase [Candidatus Kaiserbacteria bacterium GW2011_GWA2_52_12]KKW26534.1 MAG: lysyl-tRNA synthetase [Candidatus Kaiserbacteria bacterium GW2011_GWB1_52_6]
MSEQDLRDERLKKLALLKAAGMEAYPAQAARDTSNADFLAQFVDRESSGRSCTLAGRVMSLRGQGGIIFGDLFDGTGRTQIVLQQNEMIDLRNQSLFDLFVNAVDVGDFIEATGVAFKTQRGQQSLKVAAWRMLAKSLLPMPTEHFGIKDEELRLRERYLDILLNPETRAMFERRARFWFEVRAFMITRGFLEVETPILETSPGGADARPFITHHNALDIDVYLRISAGELWQKKLLIAGFPKVFEIGRIFRNEGQSREHLQDYTQLESYEAFSDVEKGMQFVQELYRHIVKEVYGKYTFEINGHTVDFAEEWPVIDFGDLIKAKFGIDPLSCSEKDVIQAVRDAQIQVGEELNRPRAIDHLWKSLRKGISGPAFLVGIPTYLEPLAKRSSKNPDTVERLQVILAGSEMGKGYSELNDPQDQRARFEEQQKMRDAGDDEAQRLDEEYVRAMEYGMPPAFGFGVSERLFAFLENKPAHETQLFPLLRPKQ